MILDGFVIDSHSPTLQSFSKIISDAASNVTFGGISSTRNAQTPANEAEQFLIISLFENPFLLLSPIIAAVLVIKALLFARVRVEAEFAYKLEEWMEDGKNNLQQRIDSINN